METKECNTCHEDKPLTDFHKHSRNPDGRKYKCKDCFRIYKKGWRQDNPEKVKKYNKKSCKNYYNKNKARKRKYERERRKNDPSYKITCSLRTRIYDALKENHKSEKTEKLLGISINEFKEYLERQFEDGMSWDNYGEWHIDHIVPCASFDLSKPHHQKECFFYTNLQPLWAEDNLSKSDKL